MSVNDLILDYLRNIFSNDRLEIEFIDDLLCRNTADQCHDPDADPSEDLMNIFNTGDFFSIDDQQSTKIEFYCFNCQKTLLRLKSGIAEPGPILVRVKHS